MHRNPVIVQISDLHFGKNVRPWKRWKPSINEEAKAALRQATLQIDPRPDFLIVTGDVANRGILSELQEGRAYLDSILNDLWRERHVARCILVPGNHDAWLTTWAHPFSSLERDDRLEDWNKVFVGWSFLAPDLKDHEAAKDLRPMSLSVYYKAHGGPGGGALAESEAEKRANRAMQLCEFFPAFGVAFLKLDSNKLDERPAHIARGMLGLDQRHEVENIVRDYEKATQDENNGFANVRRIALVHHHLTRRPKVKQEKWMLMGDAGEVARWLARLGVRLVLHGHYHRADIVGLTYWNADASNSKVETIIVSAGSATALDVGGTHNSYHRIDIGHFHTRVRRPRLEFGEHENLNDAQSFRFTHKPNLRFEEENLNGQPPFFLELLELAVAGEERYADQNHIYTAVRSTGFIDDDRAYFGSVELEGRNHSRQPTAFIPFVFTAIGMHYFDECECQAIDLKTGNKLAKPELSELRPIYVFPCRIFFAEPLAQNQDFRIRVDFRLKMVMMKERDYDMLSLIRFPRGVGKTEICLLSRKNIIGPTLWELHGDRLVRSKSAVKKVSEIPENPIGTQHTDGFRAEINSPSALAYVLCYEKLDERKTASS
jgi:3',5'-cyclic AMP phosphodiesterase CpdA